MTPYSFGAKIMGMGVNHAERLAQAAEKQSVWGALGVGVALLAFSAAWISTTDHHLWGIVVAAIGVCFIVVGLAAFVYWVSRIESSPNSQPKPIIAALDRSESQTLPDGRTLTTYPPRVIIGTPAPPHAAIGPTGSLKLNYIPGSDSRTQKVMFKTESAHEAHIPTTGSPRALRFLRPHAVIVREEELPVEVPTGDGGLVIKRFVKDGFILDEVGTYGVEVEAEVYLKTER